MKKEIFKKKKKKPLWVSRIKILQEFKKNHFDGNFLVHTFSQFIKDD
jgi:hypothetical protein